MCDEKLKNRNLHLTSQTATASSSPSVQHTKMALLLLDFPQGHNFGMDWMSWSVGDQFMGISNVPEGSHFVYWSAKEKSGSDMSIRSGRFLHFAPNQIHVWTWDADAETCVVLALEDAVKYQQGVARHDFDQRLGPYPIEHHDKWISLTQHMTKATLERLAPVHGTTGGAGGTTFYTTLPGRRPAVLTDFSPSEITKYAFDRTQALSEVLVTLSNKQSLAEGGGDDSSSVSSSSDNSSSDSSIMSRFLGELEYAFVSFVVGQSADGLEQWKSLVDLVCRCEDAMEGKETKGFQLIPTKEFYIVLDVLMAQLLEVPEDFFNGDLSSNNFLRPALSSFYQLLPEEKGRALSDLTQSRFGWDVEAEEEDELFG